MIFSTFSDYWKKTLTKLGIIQEEIKEPIESIGGVEFITHEMREALENIEKLNQLASRFKECEKSV